MARLPHPVVLAWISVSLAALLTVSSPAFASRPQAAPSSPTTASAATTPDPAATASPATVTALFEGTLDAMPDTVSFDYDRGTTLPALAAGALRAPATARIPFQRFDVAAASADGWSLRWSGVVDPAREARLWVWDTSSDAWDKVASARGTADGDLVLSAPAKAAHVDHGVVHAMVTAVDPFADDLAKPVDDRFDDPSSYAFSVVHFSDTQYLTEGAVERRTAAERAAWRRAYQSIPDWIVANAVERKIAYVAHTGDVVEDWLQPSYPSEAAARKNAKAQFQVASEIQATLDRAGLVNSVLPGNHDSRMGTEVGASALFNDYFGPDRYEEASKGAQWQAENASYHPWRDGDNDNHYDLFTAGGLDFIAVNLGYGVTPEEMAWANRVLARYSDRNAILLTHAFNKPSTASDGREADFSNDGERLENEVVRQNPNVMLVLSGHEHGVSIKIRRDFGRPRNNVVELLSDYQYYEVKASRLGLAGVGGHTADDPLRFGSSFLHLLQVDTRRSELSIDTFSPLLNDFNATEFDNEHRYDGSEDDTRVPIQLTTRRTSFTTHRLDAVATPVAEAPRPTVTVASRPTPSATPTPERVYAQVAVLLPSTAYGLGTTAFVSVRSQYGVPCSGQVRLSVDKKTLATVALDDGTATVRLPAGSSLGGHVVNTEYLGDDHTFPAGAESTFTVEEVGR